MYVFISIFLIVNPAQTPVRCDIRCASEVVS
jgi:hypothetical protein